MCAIAGIIRYDGEVAEQEIREMAHDYLGIDHTFLGIVIDDRHGILNRKILIGDGCACDVGYTYLTRAIAVDHLGYQLAGVDTIDDSSIHAANLYGIDALQVCAGDGDLRTYLSLLGTEAGQLGSCHLACRDVRLLAPDKQREGYKQ